MEYIEGEALAHVLSRAPAELTAAKIISYAKRIVLIDFGVAKETLVRDFKTLTRAGDPVGTAKYMSPEQFQDASSVEQSTDIYSFGQILYELLKICTDIDSPQFEHLRQLSYKMAHVNKDLRPHISSVAEEFQQLSLR